MSTANAIYTFLAHPTSPRHQSFSPAESDEFLPEIIDEEDLKGRHGLAAASSLSSTTIPKMIYQPYTATYSYSPEFLPEIVDETDCAWSSLCHSSFASTAAFCEFLPEIKPTSGAELYYSGEDPASPFSSGSSLSYDDDEVDWAEKRGSFEEEEVFMLDLGSEDEKDAYTGKPRGNGRFSSPSLLKMEEDRRGRSRLQRPLLSWLTRSRSTEAPAPAVNEKF
jgi:hypothetical protein